MKIVGTVGCNFGTSMSVKYSKIPESTVQHQSQVISISMVRHIRSTGVLGAHRENVNMCVLSKSEDQTQRLKILVDA